MIYLDNAATTKIDRGVLDAMMPYLTEEYGNPGSVYRFGREMNKAVQEAREKVSRFVGGENGKIIFTSGGSESNCLALHGVKEYLKQIGKTHILVSCVEHDSVLRAASALLDDGFDVEYIPVSQDSTVSLSSIEKLTRADTGLISVMYVNNETGAVNPVSEIGSFCIKHDILFHTDCVQAAGCHPINAVDIGCDLLSISSHKIHGPKGIGALYVKSIDILRPIINGGSTQEYGIRGGTENVAGIVGFGAACEVAQAHLQEDRTYVSTLKQKFVTELVSCLRERGADDIIHINGGSLMSPGKIVNIRINGIDNESLILMLDSRDICVSAGSACQSHEANPSHVLTAIGLTKDEARSSIRVSFSRMNTVEEIIEASHVISDFICLLRGHKSEE